MKLPSTYEFAHPFSSLTQKALLPLRDYARVFIETGSNVGLGVVEALNAGFEEVHSVDEAVEFTQRCRQKFEGDARVNLYTGPSPEVLRAILKLVLYKTPAVIYLDAHSSASNPLLHELRVIRDSGRTRDVILIDDVRMFGTPDWYHIQLTEALDLLRQINPKFDVSYVDTPNGPGDLLVARPPRNG